MPRGTATATVDADEESKLFPELDKDNEQHKELARRVKKYVKVKVSRDELLTTSKEECDKAMDSVLEAMHSCGFDKCKIGDTIVEAIAGKEKVKIKIDPEEETEDGDGDEE